MGQKEKLRLQNEALEMLGTSALQRNSFWGMLPQRQAHTRDSFPSAKFKPLALSWLPQAQPDSLGFLMY